MVNDNILRAYTKLSWKCEPFRFVLHIQSHKSVQNTNIAIKICNCFYTILTNLDNFANFKHFNGYQARGKIEIRKEKNSDIERKRKLSTSILHT